MPKHDPHRCRDSGHRLLGVALVAAVILLAGSAGGQTLSISGGNISLSFSTPPAGSDFADVSDATSCALSWNRPSGFAYHITVHTTTATSIATLRVQATNVVRGNATGTVTIGTTPRNVVEQLQAGNGSCNLEYTASASLADGPGTDVFTVIYTIVSGPS